MVLISRYIFKVKANTLIKGINKKLMEKITLEIKKLSDIHYFFFEPIIINLLQWTSYCCCDKIMKWVCCLEVQWLIQYNTSGSRVDDKYVMGIWTHRLLTDNQSHFKSPQGVLAPTQRLKIHVAILYVLPISSEKDAREFWNEVLTTIW